MKKKPLCGNMLLIALFLVAFVHLTEAQEPGKIFRIGYLDNSTASGSATLIEGFRQELRKLGWIEGKNIILEYRFSEQKSERLRELAAELVVLKSISSWSRKLRWRWPSRAPQLPFPS